MGEQHSEEADGSRSQSDGGRKRSRSFIAPLTQTEGVVVQRASSHAAAMELKTKHMKLSFSSPFVLSKSRELSAFSHLFLDVSVVGVVEGRADQQQVVTVTKGRQQGEL